MRPINAQKARTHLRKRFPHFGFRLQRLQLLYTSSITAQAISLYNLRHIP